ncbi:MAG: NAD-dependent deacylase [candidate division Zixibacteria bacterium]|nr:NAD-dependent deacylase [candidate division Zixibacteria bacterium]
MSPIVISERLIDALTADRVRVVVLTGAGVSAESGIPTFRSAGGYWKSYRPEDLATPEAFARDPRTVWEWYAHRRRLVAGAEPNPAHIELARWEMSLAGFTLITQNVDGLHRRAGSRQPFELHGNITESICHRCRQSQGSVGLGPKGELPACACGGKIRPAVVWFGEPLPQRTLQLAGEAAERADVYFSIGTSSIVQPAADLAYVAKEAGAYLIEINPEETAMSRLFDECLRGPAGAIVPEIGKRVFDGESHGITSGVKDIHVESHES